MIHNETNWKTKIVFFCLSRKKASKKVYKTDSKKGDFFIQFFVQFIQCIACTSTEPLHIHTFQCTEAIVFLFIHSFFRLRWMVWSWFLPLFFSMIRFTDVFHIRFSRQNLVYEMWTKCFVYNSKCPHDLSSTTKTLRPSHNPCCNKVMHNPQCALWLSISFK